MFLTVAVLVATLACTDPAGPGGLTFEGLVSLHARPLPAVPITGSVTNCRNGPLGSEATTSDGSGRYSMTFSVSPDAIVCAHFEVEVGDTTFGTTVTDLNVTEVGHAYDLDINEHNSIVVVIRRPKP